MVAVSAGDSLETVMAAYGSGAAARSIRSGAPLMNVDIGGGTSKIAVCADGKVIDVTALDVGARLVVLDDAAPHRAARRSRPPLRRRAWLEARARRDALRTTGASACGAHGRQSVRGDEGRLAARRRRRPVAARSADVARRGVGREFFRRRLRIHLWRRGQSVRRYRPAARRRSPRAAARLGAATGAARRAHPRHRDRRLAIHDAGLRQHDLRVAARNAAAAQRAGDRADPAARRRDDRFRGDRRGDQSGAEAARSRRRPKSGRGLRAVARLGDLPPARRFLQRRRRRAWRRCWPTAIPSCSPATATSAA